MEPQEQKSRGKSADTLLTEALEDLNRLVQAPDVDEAKIQAQRTRVIALKQRVAAKQKNKKIDKLDQLRMVVKTLEEKVAALTTEVEALKQRLVEPVPQVDPAATTLATLMADSFSSPNNSAISPTLERMRRGEKVGGGLMPTPPPPTPPRVEPRVEPRVKPVAQPQPVPPAEDPIEAKAARIQAAARLSAPTSVVAAIETIEKRIAELQNPDGYQQTLAVEAVFPAKSTEEVVALDLMDKRYGDSAEARAKREQSIQAAIANAQKAKEPLPDPTCDAIREIEAGIAHENEVREKLRIATEEVNRLQARKGQQ
jgi:hypothetical protein